MRNRLISVAAVALSAGLLMSGCSSSDSQATGCDFNTTVGDVTVAGSTGSKAEVTIAEGAQPVTDLVVEDLCPGTGAAVTANSTITADYVGVALSTGETFDASYDRGESGEPLVIPLNNLIPGWQDGLLGMQEGGTRLLVIPGEQAYGEVSPGPGIGPNETLVFVVDLISVEDGS